MIKLIKANKWPFFTLSLLLFICAVLYCGTSILNVMNMRFRPWIFFVAAIIIEGLIWFLLFYLFHFFIKVLARKIIVLKIVFALVFSAITLVMLVVMLFITVFLREIEHIIHRDGYKMVACVDTGLLDTSVDYYEYKNAFAMGALLISEGYNGSNDPLSGYINDPSVGFPVPLIWPRYYYERDEDDQEETDDEELRYRTFENGSVSIRYPEKWKHQMGSKGYEIQFFRASPTVIESVPVATLHPVHSTVEHYSKTAQEWLEYKQNEFLDRADIELMECRILFENGFEIAKTSYRNKVPQEGKIEITSELFLPNYYWYIFTSRYDTDNERDAEIMAEMVDSLTNTRVSPSYHFRDFPQTKEIPVVRAGIEETLTAQLTASDYVFAIYLFEDFVFVSKNRSYIICPSENSALPDTVSMEIFHRFDATSLSEPTINDGIVTEYRLIEKGDYSFYVLFHYPLEAAESGVASLLSAMLNSMVMRPAIQN